MASVGKTLVNRTTGLKNANDSLKGRVFEASLADLQKDEDHSFRKVKLRVDEVQGKNCLTNFYGLDFTHDKPLTAEQVRAVEDRVNRQVIRDLPVGARVLDDEAEPLAPPSL